jgi:hypothetical protein
MKLRRRIRLIISVVPLGLAALLLAQAAFGGKVPEIIVLDKCKKRKPPVKFFHVKHHKRIAKLGQNCTVCHHKGDPAKGPKAGKGCPSCHMKPVKGLGTCQDMSLKKNPFHARCIGCHKEQKKKGKLVKGPTRCNKCHVK